MHSLSPSGSPGLGGKRLICEFVSLIGHFANLFYPHFISFDSVSETKTIFLGTSQILLCNDGDSSKKRGHLSPFSFLSFLYLFSKVLLGC